MSSNSLHAHLLCCVAVPPCIQWFWTAVLTKVDIEQKLDNDENMQLGDDDEDAERPIRFLKFGTLLFGLGAASTDIVYRRDCYDQLADLVLASRERHCTLWGTPGTGMPRVLFLRSVCI